MIKWKKNWKPWTFHKNSFRTFFSVIAMGKQTVATTPTPSFTAFYSTSELWKDHWQRFETFSGANQISDDCKALVFLTNQSPSLDKQVAISAGQQNPPKAVSKLPMSDIQTFMDKEFNSKHFIITERFNFCNDMQRRS